MMILADNIDREMKKILKREEEAIWDSFRDFERDLRREERVGETGKWLMEYLEGFC
jgi:hypothetical protein